MAVYVRIHEFHFGSADWNSLFHGSPDLDGKDARVVGGNFLQPSCFSRGLKPSQIKMAVTAFVHVLLINLKKYDDRLILYLRRCPANSTKFLTLVYNVSLYDKSCIYAPSSISHCYFSNYFHDF